MSMKGFAFGFALAVAVLLAPFASRANMLYWEVYNPDVYVSDANGGTYAQLSLMTKPSAFGAKVAVINVEKSKDGEPPVVEKFLDTWYYDENTAQYVSMGSDFAAVQDGYVRQRWSDLGDYADAPDDTWLFAIAIFNDKGQVMAISETASYSDLYDQYVADVPEQIPWVTEWRPEGYVIPEPSCGFLTLIGLMVFGLKRKQEVV